jgi:hypothetical protein
VDSTGFAVESVPLSVFSGFVPAGLALSVTFGDASYKPLSVTLGETIGAVTAGEAVPTGTVTVGGVVFPGVFVPVQAQSSETSTRAGITAPVIFLNILISSIKLIQYILHRSREYY